LRQKNQQTNVQIHSTAEVALSAKIGHNTVVWHHCQIGENAHIGQNCILGKDVYVDRGVTIGNNVKIQNGCYIYHGSILEDGVFLGPGVILTNDKLPRAINPDGSLKTAADWQAGKILIKRGASIGAGAIVLPDITVGIFSLIGAGTVVTKDVPDYGLMIGNPGQLVGFVCACGGRLQQIHQTQKWVDTFCKKCGQRVQIPISAWQLMIRDAQ
jgi:acetyltransferase-like isoleucine patch superfamily enzyme